MNIKLIALYSVLTLSLAACATPMTSAGLAQDAQDTYKRSQSIEDSGQRNTAGYFQLSAAAQPVDPALAAAFQTEAVNTANRDKQFADRGRTFGENQMTEAERKQREEMKD